MPHATTSQSTPLSKRLRVPLPYNKARPLPELGGTVTLLKASSGHYGDGLDEASSGVIELSREGQSQQVSFQANRAFDAWGYRMAVFGASGSYELGVFPPGAPFEP